MTRFCRMWMYVDVLVTQGSRNAHVFDRAEGLLEVDGGCVTILVLAV